MVAHTSNPSRPSNQMGGKDSRILSGELKASQPSTHMGKVTRDNISQGGKSSPTPEVGLWPPLSNSGTDIAALSQHRHADRHTDTHTGFSQEPFSRPCLTLHVSTLFEVRFKAVSPPLPGPVLAILCR